MCSLENAILMQQQLCRYLIQESVLWEGDEVLMQAGFGERKKEKGGFKAFLDWMENTVE